MILQFLSMMSVEKELFPQIANINDEEAVQIISVLLLLRLEAVRDQF